MRDSGLVGCRKERGGMHDRRFAGKEGFRTRENPGGIQVRKDAGQERCRKG